MQELLPNRSPEDNRFGREADYKIETIAGVMIYDPRDESYSVSNNPALILRDIIKRFGRNPDIDDSMIKDLADYCDAKSYQLNLVLSW